MTKHFSCWWSFAIYLYQPFKNKEGRSFGKRNNDIYFSQSKSEVCVEATKFTWTPCPFFLFFSKCESNQTPSRVTTHIPNYRCSYFAIRIENSSILHRPYIFTTGLGERPHIQHVCVCMCRRQSCPIYCSVHKPGAAQTSASLHSRLRLDSASTLAALVS